MQIATDQMFSGDSLDPVKSINDGQGIAQGLLRGAAALLLDEPTEGLDAPTAAQLLAGVREFDPNAALVIALHDRQSLVLPWTPTARLDLTRRERDGGRHGRRDRQHELLTSDSQTACPSPPRRTPPGTGAK